MLKDFTWSKEETEGESHYKGAESLNCQIGINPEGKFEIRNLSDPSQSETFETAEEMGEALARTLSERVSH